MTTLQDQLIIFDDQCPMCQLYTREFVRQGILQPENRRGFSEVEVEEMEELDVDRSRHEIPLVDQATGEVRYGLEALFFLLGERWSWMKPIFRLKAIQWLLYPLYQLITYNRRLMAGTQASGEGFDCAPDFHLGWRLTYLGLSWGAVVALMVGLVPQLFTTLPILGLIWLVAGAKIALLGFLQARSNWDHHGNLSSSWLVGMLLWGICSWGGSVGFAVGSLASLVLICVEYVRRKLV
ncbi:MAG: hypothetical protein AAF399_16675 [Bacteroidota bacterium]